MSAVQMYIYLRTHQEALLFWVTPHNGNGFINAWDAYRTTEEPTSVKLNHRYGEAFFVASDIVGISLDDE